MRSKYQDLVTGVPNSRWSIGGFDLELGTLKQVVRQRLDCWGTDGEEAMIGHHEALLERACLQLHSCTKRTSRMGVDPCTLDMW